MRAACSVDGCEKSVAARGVCPMHYYRLKSTGDVNKTPSGRTVREPGQVCEVAGCGQPMRKLKWCASHYSQWKRKGAVTSFGYKWATEFVCVVCGSEVEPGTRRRKHCSGRCQALDSMHRGARPREASCVRCGSSIDLLSLSKAGQFIRTDTKMCAKCRSARHLRHGFSVLELSARDGSDCGICAQPVDMSLSFPHPLSPSVDHVIPYARGGSHDMSNLQVSHLRCNHIKSDRSVTLTTGQTGELEVSRGN